MAAADKEIRENEVRDGDRLEFIRSHLDACNRAIGDGVNLKGYYYWSLMDNFEWTAGYSKRFGLVRIDYSNLKRTVKNSGKWYGEFIRTQKEKESYTA